jgi:hypothetical protein
MGHSIKNKFLQILVQIVAWAVFLLLLTLLVPQPSGRNPVFSTIICDLFFILFFYANYYIFVPQYFIPKRYILYSIICIACLVVIVAVPSLVSEVSHLISPRPDRFPGPPPAISDPGFMKPDMPPGPPPQERFGLFKPVFRYIILIFFLMLTLSLGICVLVQWQQSEKEKINVELASLKDQINPHFLFNALNSIYSLAVNKAENTPYAIEKFSDIMRFVIYEARYDFVPLLNKIEYINNYISLQKLRLSSHTTVNYEVIGDPATYQIAPLVLMPFIENAFKHGISTENESSIEIKIIIEKDKLHLTVKNEKFRMGETLNGISQVGIENTKRRLNLIYPGKHNLEITSTETEYLVSLYIDLK